MAQMIKTNNVSTAISDEGASDSISFDGFDFFDFHGEQNDATAPADIIQSQNAASLVSAEAGIDQNGKNGNTSSGPMSAFFLCCLQRSPGS
jgi:hypothetical protein